MAELPTFRAVAMRDAVADALRRALLERKFSPGEALIESAIAAQMKVSRGPVREALLLLTQEGLVTHSQNRGFAVLNFTEKERRDGDQVRLILEALALELARERVTAADLEELERLRVELLALFDSPDAIARLDKEIEFHRSIWSRSGNVTLENELLRVTIPIFTFVTAYYLNESSITADVFEEQHRLYIDYLRRRTDRTAEECVRYHLSLPVARQKE